MTSSRISSAPCAAVIRRSVGVEAVQRRDDAHVAGGGLADDAGDLGAALGEDGLDGGDVVVGQDDGVGGGAGGDAGGVGQAEGRDAGAGRGEQRVDVAVVVAGELHDQRAAGGAAGQPDGRQHRLGAGVDQPHPLDRGDPVADLLGQVELALGRGAEGQPAPGGGGDGLDDGGVRVAQDHRPPRADQVDVAASVGVGDPGPGALDHEARGAADGAEGAHRAVHPARRDRLAAVEEVGRDRGLVGVGGAVQRGHDPSVPCA